MSEGKGVTCSKLYTAVSRTGYDERKEARGCFFFIFRICPRGKSATVISPKFHSLKSDFLHIK